MKIILHMGQSKTGTTSIQDALRDAAPMLRQKGISYPNFVPGLRDNKLIFSLCADASRLSPWFLENNGGAENAIRMAHAGWERICRSISRNPPEVMVLSSEMLIHKANGQEKARLAGFLSPLSTDITPVAYIRHPVDHYRSRLQQWMKSRPMPHPPTRLRIRQAVEESLAAFGREPELIAFDRKTLHGGDVVVDFATRFLAPWIDPADLPSVSSNVGISPEALVLIAQLRNEAGGTYEAARFANKFVPILADLDRRDPPTRPFTLLPEVAEAALRSAVDFHWLAETGRLRIPGLDLSKIDGAPVPEWMRTAPTETLFLHDPERLARLRAAVESTDLMKRGMHRALAEARRPDSLRLRLMRYLRGKQADFQQ